MSENLKPWKTLPKGFQFKQESDSEKILKSLDNLSQKIKNHEKELMKNKRAEYEFQGNLSKENIWSAFSLAIGSAFLSVGIAISFGVFEIINDSSTAQEINWNFISAYQNMGALMSIGGLFLIGVGAYGSYYRVNKFIKKIMQFSNLNPSLSKTSTNQNKTNPINWQIHLGLGISIIIIGLVFFLVPISNDREEVTTWEGFDIARQHNLTLSSLNFNLVTLEETQSLHIYYATEEITGENPFLMFFIPYLGTLTNPEGTKYSVPEPWQTHKIPELHTTILYKFFDCTDEDYCSDQLNMYFDFDEKIDSKQYYHHSINIPFKSANHRGVVDAQNDILEHVPVYQISQEWGLRDGKSPELTLSVLDDSTEYNAIPDGYLKSRNHNSTGVTNSVMVWDIPYKTIDFHLDYVDPNQRYLYDNLRLISIVLFGTGTAFLVVSTSEYFNWRKSRHH